LAAVVLRVDVLPGAVLEEEFQGLLHDTVTIGTRAVRCHVVKDRITSFVRGIVKTADGAYR
jgi:plasmid maintenance system antidote protein VapI